MTRILLNIFFCLFTISSIAQPIKKSAQNGKTEGLNVGEKLPNIKFKSIINYAGKILASEDLKGKLVIFDFFSTYCEPCIGEFPRFDSLQKEFGDKIQFVLVTYQKKMYVENFIKKNSITKRINLPIITDDTLLVGRKNSYFKMSSVPTEVWISKEGKYLGITDNDFVTRENISKVLNEHPPKFINKIAIEYNTGEPLISLMDRYNFLSSNILHYSYLGKFQPELGGTVGLPVVEENDNVVSIQETNLPILDLFKIAYGEKKYEGFYNCQIIHPRPESYYRYDGKSGLNLFCYEAKVSYVDKKSIKKVYDLMKKDLNNAFRLTGRVESRKIKCYNFSIDTSFRGGDLQADTLLEFDLGVKLVGKTDIIFQKKQLDDILFVLMNSFSSPIYLKNESLSKLPISLDIDLNDFLDFPALKSKLTKQGINITEGDIEKECIILSEAATE